MALPTETTGYTYGWSPNDFIQNFLAEGSDDRGGAIKGAMESSLSILEGDVVELGTSFRQIKAKTTTTTGKIIGVALSEESSTLQEVYEPYLIMKGFINRTPRGREVTKLGYEHMGKIFPNKSGETS